MTGPTREIFDDISNRLLEYALTLSPGLQIKTGALALAAADDPPRVVLVRLREVISAPSATAPAAYRHFAQREVTCEAHLWGAGETAEDACDQIETVLLPSLIKSLREYKTTAARPISGEWRTEQSPAYSKAGALYVATFTLTIPVAEERQRATVSSATIAGQQQRADGSFENVVP